DAGGARPIREGAVALVSLQVIRPVPEGVAHAGRNEDILPAVVIEIADGDPPGPERLQAGLIGDLLEPVLAEVLEEGVAEKDLVVMDLEEVGEELLVFQAARAC